VERQRNQQKVFVGYITAGDPDLETTKTICHLLADNGVDIIELGIPFSDPLADGPTNQRAAQRALASGTTTKKIMSMVRDLRDSGFTTPILFFTYLNPIFRMGYRQFAENAKHSGIDGVLCLDLPPEESGDYMAAMQSQALGTVFLASPTSDIRRLKSINDASSAFVYYVSRTGVTGTQSEVSETLEEELDTVRKFIKKPLMIGFGISNPEQAQAIARWGDGIVIGSAIVNRIEHLNENPLAADDLKNFIRGIRHVLN
jgi:tryptophan synthase alpha chain